MKPPKQQTGTAEQWQPDIHDLVRELTEPVRHREAYVRDGRPRTEHHTTDHPSLLQQLAAAGEASTGAGEDGARTAYGSRPAARLEALDAFVRIDLGAARWVRDMGEDDPLDTATCVRLVVALSGSAFSATRRAVEKDVRRWWTWARVLTGWDSPAWQPDNTCPLCGRKGGLRVHLVAQAATCVHCTEAWSPATLGLLVEHIRLENREDDDTPTEPAPLDTGGDGESQSGRRQTCAQPRTGPPAGASPSSGQVSP